MSKDPNANPSGQQVSRLMQYLRDHGVRGQQLSDAVSANPEQETRKQIAERIRSWLSQQAREARESKT